MINRRVARPEDIASRDGVLDAIRELGAPWQVYTGPAVARALRVSPLLIGDWRYSGRSAPPHEKPSMYPRTNGYLYRADRLEKWLHQLSNRPGQVDLWFIGRDYLKDVLGLPHAGNRRELDDQILQLYRIGVLSIPSILPAKWPYRFYADRPFELNARYAYDDDGG